MKRQKGLEGITEIELNKDARGFFIPYCSLSYHEGILDVGKSEICEERDCIHYKRLYINDQ